jgi:hypothetical protein
MYVATHSELDKKYKECQKSHSGINMGVTKVVKVKLSFCLTNQELRREGVLGSGCIDPHFPDLDICRRWVIHFTPLPLYPRGKSPPFHWIGGWVAPRNGLDDVEKRKFLTLPGLEIRPLGRPARSQLLYRLRYPGYTKLVPDPVI